MILSAALAAPGSAHAGKACYSLAPPPLASAVRTESQWAPFVAALAERSGVCLTLRMSSGGSQFESRMVAGEPSFAVPTPSVLVYSAKAVRYQPLVRSDLRRLRGILVVRSDAGIDRVADLVSPSIVDIGVPSSSARFMSIAPQLELRRAGVRCRAVDLADPSNVLRAVALGKVPVGASLDLILAEYEPAIRQQLRIIFATRPHLPPPLAAHPRVAAPVREAVARAVLGMQDDAAGRALLESVRMPAPVRTDLAEYAADLRDVPDPSQGCTATR